MPPTLTARPAPAARSLSSASIRTLTLTEPLAGFPGHRDYVLVPADPTGVLFWLQSVTPEGPRFLAVPAPAFFPDYSPALPAAALAELALPERRAAELFCLVTILDGDVATATANLRAPVVVNRDTSRACQVVLTDALHPIRRSLRR